MKPLEVKSVKIYALIKLDKMTQRFSNVYDGLDTSSNGMFKTREEAEAFMLMTILKENNSPGFYNIYELEWPLEKLLEK